MKPNKISHIPLYIFTLIGVLLWGSTYLLTPAIPTEVFSLATSSYIGLSFLIYFFGYFLLHFSKYNFKKELKSITLISEKVIWTMLFMVLISWLIRYYDLFFNRGVSFYNSIKVNRTLLGEGNLNFIYIFAAIFKELYFFPLALTLIFYKKNKVLVLLSSLLFFLPLIIPFLRGTRKDVFLVFIFLGLVLFISKTIFFKLKTIAAIGLVFLVLNVVFYQVLVHRESPKFTSKSSVSEEILNKASYNDLYKPTEEIKNMISSSEGLQKALLFNTLHIAQYYCHGIFELNYLVNQKNQKNDYHDGYYTFHLATRFLTKLNIIELNTDLISKPLPRKSTYITFLGSLFLDFGWFGLIFMFFLGCFQRFIDEKIRKGELLFISLYMFFIVFNVLLPVIDIIRGTGTYVMFSSITVVIVYDLISKSKFIKFIK
jgi:hypothetical protein